ncbi:SEL1-like repeat protein [Tateyamaria pelophila]|uniref:sel1 repeat family protein n=1 Tax=Tateyamaria pelophila TaxID=328415 RepID=UPI001CBCB857|nr:sel1 repeat family protein [Tateyamaria pelophila]
MKRIFHVVALTTTLTLGGQAVLAQDLAKGWEAYKQDDYAAALLEVRPLAEQGYAPAQFILGMMYFLGRGLIQDNVYAHMWFNIAASFGDEEGATYRDIVSERMTPADLSEAQKLARECVAKNYKGC